MSNENLKNININIPPPPQITNISFSPPSVPDASSNPITSLGDSLVSKSADERLLNIINNKLGRSFDKIEEAKEAVKDLSGDLTSDKALKTLVDDYDAAKDEAAKKKIVDEYESSNSNLITPFAFPTLTMPTVPAMSAAPTMPASAIPGMAGIPSGGIASGGLDTLGQSLSGLTGLAQSVQALTGDQNKPAVPATTAANIPVSYTDKLNEVQAASDITWASAPKVDGIKNAADTAIAVNEPIGAVSANFDKNGNYILNDKDPEKNKGQVTADKEKIGETITATNEDAKNTYLSKGNDAAQKLFNDGKGKTEKEHGVPNSGSPQDVIGSTPEGKIPAAQKAEYEKVQTKYGLEEEDATNKNKVTAKYSPKTKKDDVDSAVTDNYGKDADNVGVLQGKLDYLGNVEQGAQGDYTKFKSQMTQAEQVRAHNQNMANSATKAEIRAQYQELADQAKADKEKAKKEMDKRKEVLDEAKAKKPDIENKLKASAKARTEQLAAIKSGTKKEVADAIKAKQETATKVKSAVDAVATAVKNGATGLLDMNALADASSLFKDAAGIVAGFNKDAGDLRTATKEKLDKLEETKKMLDKILAELKKDEKEKGAKKDENITIAPASEDKDEQKQKVTIKTDGSDYKFDLSGARAVDETSGATKPGDTSQRLAQFVPKYLNNPLITNEKGYTPPGDLFNATDTGTNTGFDFPTG